MKIKIFIILILLTFSISSFSQNTFLGLKAGPILTNHTNNFSASDYKLSYSVGAFINYKKKYRPGFTLEANLISKGGSIKAYTSATTYENIKTSLTVLSLVGHLDIYPIEGVTSFYSLLGPRVDRIMSRDDNGLDGLYKDVEGWYWGLMAGLGVSFNRNTGKGYFWGFEFRLAEDISGFNLSDYTYKGRTSTYYTDNKFHNRSFELLFNIGNNPNLKSKKFIKL